MSWPLLRQAARRAVHLDTHLLQPLAHLVRQCVALRHLVGRGDVESEAARDQRQQRAYVGTGVAQASASWLS